MTQAPLDVYPTRTAPQPFIAERLDPVVWGDLHNSGDGPLTSEQLAFYDTHGYLARDGGFPADVVADYRLELTRLHHDPATRDLPHARFDPNPADPTRDDLRAIYGVHQLSDAFAALAHREELVAAARQILGSDVYLHQSRLDLRPPFHGRGTDWHSDFERWHADDGVARPRAVVALVALTDADAFTAPLVLAPGSQRHFVACIQARPDTPAAQGPDPACLAAVLDDTIVAPTGEAGLVILYDANTLHAAPPNLSPRAVASAAFVYNSVRNTPDAPYAGGEPRPEYVAARDFTPAGEQAPVAD